MTEQLLEFTSGGQTVSASLTAPSLATGYCVILCHGLTNNREDAPLFDVLKKELLARGVGVFSFDFVGSGQSDGQFRDKRMSVMRTNLEDAVGFAADSLGDRTRLALFGRSVGGTMASFVAADPRITASVIASPVLKLSEQFEPYREAPGSPYVHMPEHLGQSGQIKGPWELHNDFFDELPEVEAALSAAVEGATGVLLIHGELDTKVDPQHSRELLELLGKDRSLQIIDGAGHNYTGVEEQVVRLAVEWFAGRAG